jgi:molybdenum cofactor cytidylyltransferase
MSHYFEKDRDTLGLALRQNCRYVGLLSSRKRRDAIFKELASGGVPNEALRRAGIDIRSVTDPEIAVSIVAELVATRNRGARKKIAGILLAAGRGERFGKSKLLVEIAGMPLIGHVLKSCIDSLLTEIIVIMGSRRDILQREIRWHFSGEKKIRFVVNEDPGRGMMSSLKAGLEALGEKCPGVMVLLADMPLVTTDVIDRLISEFELGEGIVVPECGGELHHPRILPAGLFPEFLALGDSEKGTVVLDRHTERIVRVGFEDREMFLDVDGADDFEVVSRKLESGPDQE